MGSRKTSLRKRGMSLNMRNTLVGLSFILPNFIGFFIFVLAPVVFSGLLSFMKWDGFNEMQFVAFDNFKTIFNDRVFKASLSQTFVYTIFTVALTMVASLGLALLLNRKMRGVNIFRSAIFFPYVASVVAVGSVWKAMFMKNGGVVNAFLSMIGVSGSALPGWFASTEWALAGVIIVSIWRQMGYYMVIYLAALQDIPLELREAAEIDGATKFQCFRRSVSVLCGDDCYSLADFHASAIYHAPKGESRRYAHRLYSSSELCSLWCIPSPSVL